MYSFGLHLFSYPPERTFPEGIVFGCVYFFSLFYVVCALSLEWIDGSQPNFHTRWRSGLAQTLRKMGVVGLTF